MALLYPHYRFVALHILSLPNLRLEALLDLLIFLSHIQTASLLTVTYHQLYTNVIKC